MHLSASSVARGRYRIVVSDRSKSANFHLAGPGVNARTGDALPRLGDLAACNLSKGSYRYGSDRGGLTKRLRVR